VRLAVPRSVVPIVAGLEPCYTTISLAEDENGCIADNAVNTVLDALGENDVIAFGPGVRFGRGVSKVLENLLATDGLKLLVDADGLNNLAKLKGWEKRCKAQVIVTPHPGEMKRLWDGMMRDAMPADRTELAMTYSKASGAVVVLKGAATVVTDSRRVYINDTGNPGMATPGSGDVLTGIITSLYGQKFERFEAAVLGVYVHGLAGDVAAAKHGEVSMIATDIIDCLGEAFK
jgi:ADP-dependent NAD(P)H-hydrate dehydratase